MIAGKYINMRLADESDAEFILSLRTNPLLNKHIHSTDDSICAQREWVRKYKSRESDKAEYYYIIQDKSALPCGTVRLYDFRKNSFCWGSWIMAPGAPAKAAFESAFLIYEQACSALGFSQSHFDVRKENARVVAFHERFGAERVAEDQNDFFYILSKEKYIKNREKFLKILGL